VSEWDAYADGWDDDPGAIAYSAAAFETLSRLLADRAMTIEGAHVLDFGCGTGLLTERMVTEGALVHAVDTSTAMLAVLDEKSRRHGWTSVTTSTEIPAVVQPLDVIVCSSVCSFLDDYPSAVVDLVARLRPGGLFVQWDWERIDDDEHGLTRAEIGDALRSAGLDDVVVETAFDVEMEGTTMSPLIGSGSR
jgi:2-polyprenyl-3-methyl-5-hydroxy-6-metoxy-1,4-benzoquinol methylase